MAIQKDVKIQFIEEKRGEAIQKIEQEIKNLNKNLTDLKQTNLQLKKDFGSSSQEYIDGKKKEIQAISDLKAKSKELSTINKQYSSEIKSASTEIKQIKKDEADAKKKFDRDFQDFVKRNEDIAASYAKKKSDEKKRIAKDEADAKKKFDKDFQDFVKRNETLANSSKIKNNENTSLKFKDATYPEYLKKLQFELRLLGTEQIKLIQNGQRESDVFRNNKQRIQELTAEYKGLNREMKGLDAQSKMSKAQLLEFGENLTVVAMGVAAVGSAIFGATAVAIQHGAKLKVLRDNYKGTAEDLALLSRASAWTLTEEQLIPIYNKATQQIKLTTEETARLLAASEDLADNGIGDLVTNYEAYIQAILTGGRGLNRMGISQKQFKDDLKATAVQMGINIGLIEDTSDEEEINISKLDAKTQKILVLKTLFDGGYIPSMQNVIAKTQDEADKLEAFKVKLDESKSAAGLFIFQGLEPMIDAFLNLDKGASTATGTIAAFGGGLLTIIPLIGSARIAMAGLSLSVLGLASAYAAVVIGIGAIGSAIGYATTKLYQWIDAKNKEKETGFSIIEGQNPVSNAQNDFFPWAKNYTNKGTGNFETPIPKKGMGDRLGLDKELNEELQKGNELLKERDKITKRDLDKGMKGGPGADKKVKENILTLDEVLSNLREQIKANEELFKLGSLTEKQRDDEYNNILKTLQSKKNLIELTQEGLSPDEKSLALKTNSVKYLELEADLKHRLGLLTANEIVELERKNKLLQSSLDKINEANYKTTDRSTSNIPTHKLTPLQAEEESKRLQDIENMKRSQLTSDKEKILSSEDYKRAEFLLGQLGNFFDRTMTNAWQSIFGQADNFATQFLQDFASQLISMFANWGIRNLLNSIFPGAGIITSFFGGGRASGGDVRAGGTYLVGERGPELLTMPRSGHVTSNDSIMKMVKQMSAQNGGIKIVKVPVPVLPELYGSTIKLSYDRTSEYLNDIKT